MRYAFDLFGWYTGEVDDSVRRSAPVAPANTSTTTTDGELRANWTGREWVDRQYSTPPDLDGASRLAAAKETGLRVAREQYIGLITSRLGADEAADSVVATLPVFFAMWQSIAPAARQPNAQWQWLLDARQAYAQAVSAIKAAQTLGQVAAVFPINWP